MVSEDRSPTADALKFSNNESGEPTLTVGIMDKQAGITGCLNGNFYVNGFGLVSGRFSAKTLFDIIVLTDENNHEIVRSSVIRFAADKDSTFTLFQVTIGITFHWERKEDQTFQGNLILKSRNNGTMAAINEIAMEDYLKSVVSSEMSGNAPMEFLKTHAIISRSWLLCSLNRKKNRKETLTNKTEMINSPDQFSSHESSFSLQGKQEEVMRWYEQEDHDIYDVCADDHCQRYQGVTKIISARAGESVLETCGQAITYHGEICDARYSKACGGITEAFETAWADNKVPYLISITDAKDHYQPIITEENATRWILSEPDAYCNTKDTHILEKILPDFDQETKAFFRWKVAYAREELEKILLEKSGFDFGTLKEIQPLSRGPSGRIFRLKIVGSNKSMIVGKELEIRRWLSKSHLYSSAFVVAMEYDAQGEIKNFVFHGAGWGHGVGLCQIGAAVMATKGFSVEEILEHYFPGTGIERVY